MSFKDHFSKNAARYSEFRPSYPATLFEYLASVSPRRAVAWDCATGSGQAALGLTCHFQNVVATDASRQQLDHAQADRRISYVVARAERIPFHDASIDLVTVAQALHWFELPTFYAEVKRVLRPDGIIAVWCYQMAKIQPEIDEVVDRLYDDIVGDYWPLDRSKVEEGYRTLDFPFREFEPPPIMMSETWDLHRVLGYLSTWSAVTRYRDQIGADPLDLIGDDLQAAWGDPDDVHLVVWPLDLRIGTVDSPTPGFPTAAT
jgi:SAM-dependent methyltransferase